MEHAELVDLERLLRPRGVQPGQVTEIGVGGGVADQDVDLPEAADRSPATQASASVGGPSRVGGGLPDDLAGQPAVLRPPPRPA